MTTEPARARLIRELQQVPDESWDDDERGLVTWRTLFSGSTTGTSGLTSGVARVPPDQALEPHRHEAVETSYVLRGTGLMILDHQEHPVGPGSSALIPSWTTHAIRTTGREVLEFYYACACDSFDQVVYHFDP